MNEQLYLIAEDYYKNIVLRTLIKLFPKGSVVDSTFANLYTKEKERRVKIFYDEWATGNLQLTEEYISSDDFLHKYFITVKAVLETKREEKIQFFARLLNNSQSPLADNSTDYFEDFVKVLDDLTYQELFVLIRLRKLEIEYENTRPHSQSNKISIFHSLKTKLSAELEISTDEVYSIFIRLERTGCINFIRHSDMLVHQDSITTTDFFKKLATLIMIE